MDPLASLLEGPRARDPFLLRALLGPPWAVLVRDQAPLTVLCVVRGTAWLIPEEPGGPRQLTAGSVAVLRGPAPYRVADDPASPLQAEILPGGCGVAPDGTDLCETLDLGTRTWGTGTDAPNELLIGTYPLSSEVTGSLLRALPPVLSLGPREWDCALLPMLTTEITREAPAQNVVLGRVLDLLLISVLRAWFERPSSEPPAWYRAHGDPVVGPALRLLREHPAHPWTVAALAAKVGVSRAALARRFTELVGRPPMAHLTDRRLDLAAELLLDPDLTVEAVARRVGYGSAFALSTAFKRERGITPSDHRDAAAAAAATAAATVDA
ncbi:helix-turn-helix domain-containing protein [Streptomyces sp. 3MP-14]|uniref:Helix-turn-helix domain-containing protein n=1 Tax=Streptomyces mimosae TaxID=2586635 RepID=A0A5N6AS37_9ACTN|nr:MULTISPECIES: AraC family transcriptional regulator [Streptomyces]KAB8170985.1 helix-turn-helix domain-containing protein [Streptomyces mimosae]KAB8179664.1 helix-turn-helix domain-containing protein [Streptomyces sp. 3MP-14]